MACPLHTGRWLSAYVDDRLAGWRRALVEGHLAGCTRCALAVARIRSLRRLLLSSDGPDVPPDLQLRLLGVAREGEVPDRPDDRGQGRDDGPDAHGPPARHLAGALGVVAAGLVVLGAAGAGAVVTGLTTPPPGASTGASLATRLIPGLPAQLLPWSTDPDGTATDPDGAATVQPVDNDDRP